jgi:hypothetical protein
MRALALPAKMQLLNFAGFVKVGQYFWFSINIRLAAYRVRGTG